MFPVAHLIGPGGAGKSTIGAVLARRLNWRFVDLDQCFLSWHGHIGGLIDRHGYAGYARRNIQLYADLRHRVAEPMVCALSSGFMTYPSDIAPAYPSIRSSIESDARTALLLPALDLEPCTSLIVARQLSRTYLKASAESEARKIRDRFPRLMALNCARFVSEGPVDAIAASIERFIRDSLARA